MDKSMKPYFVIMADLSEIGLFSSALFPDFFSGMSVSSLNSRREMKKKIQWEDFHANILTFDLPYTRMDK